MEKREEEMGSKKVLGRAKNRREHKLKGFI